MIYSVLLSTVLVCVSAAPASPGRLVVAHPKLSADQVVFVVALEGEVGKGVSTMTFQVNYDPEVFGPLAAKPGRSATAANKMAQGKAGKKGVYSVIVAGMNKTAVEKGEVAEITLKILSKLKEKETKIKISATSFASPEGVEVPSQGSEFTLKLDAGDGGNAPAKPEAAGAAGKSAKN